MNRCIVFLLGFLLMIPLLGQAGEIERLQKKGFITVSLNREYPPFSMERDGELFGLDESFWVES